MSVLRSVRLARHRRGPAPAAGPDGGAAMLRASVLAQHPRFAAAVVADARVAAGRRGERREFHGRLDTARQILRLCLVTDAFLAQVCYRARTRCQVRGIPLVPWILHRLSMATGQLCIGDPVVLHPGVYIPHGQVVADALTVVHAGATLSPFTTLGRVVGTMGGPTIGAFAEIGTGAKVLGRITVGREAKVGANAVVLVDVPPGATAVGVPARVLAARA